jgi:hypothetical protein
LLPPHRTPRSPAQPPRNSCRCLPSPGSTPRRRCATKRFCSSRRQAISPNLSVISHNALLLCTQLLLEDYIKWRPALFRAFCAALADAEPQVRPHHDLPRSRHLQRAPPAALPVIPVLSPPFAALSPQLPRISRCALWRTRASSSCCCRARRSSPSTPSSASFSSSTAATSTPRTRRPSPLPRARLSSRCGARACRPAGWLATPRLQPCDQPLP